MFDTGTLDAETTDLRNAGRAEQSPGFGPCELEAIDLEALDLVPLEAITPDPPGHSGGMQSVPDGIDALEPGIFLAAILTSINIERVSGHDRIILLRAHQRMASYYQARLYQDMAAVPSHLRDEEDEDPRYADEAAAAEIRAALRLTRRAADSELSFALELQRRLPAVWDALAAGQIDVRRAKTLVYGTLHLSTAAAQSVVGRIIDEAPRLTTGQLSARLRRLCIEAGPDEAKDRYREAVADRRVVTEPTTAGTANLMGLNLPPHRVAAASRHINRLALSLRGNQESRTMDQLRADVLLDLLTGGGTPTGTSEPRGVLDIRVDLTTLAGLTENPGELAGYGPVIADIARQITDHQTGAEWRYTVTDPNSGLPIDNGVIGRRPTRGQRRYVETHHPTCVFPGCRMPATACDLDHRIPWSDNGPTQTTNLAPLCRHDHNLKTSYGWAHQAQPDGDHHWITPLGHTYSSSGRPP